MILNLFICFIMTSLNTNCESQIVINGNKNIIAEQQNCSHSQSSSSDYTLEDSQNAIKSKIVKKDFKRRKKISWKRYLLIDHYQFKDDVREMFDKYVSESSHCEIKRIDDIDELYTMENINSRINIYDINEIFMDKIQDNNLINVVGKNLSHSRDDFLNFKNFIETLLSEEFSTIFYIVSRDMYNVIKNYYDYMYPKNEVLKNILLKFEQVTNENIRIVTYISVCKLILNLEIQNNNRVDDTQSIIISNILHSSYRLKDKIINISKKLDHKVNKINLNLEKNQISYCDILNYTKSLINQVTDENFRNICIFGLQNLFKKDLKYNTHRFIKILIYLYIFLNEKKYYSIDWYGYLIKYMSFSCHGCKLADITKHCPELLNKDNFYLNYHTYLAINTEFILPVLLCYKKLQMNEKQFQFVNALIVVTNKVKCKIMGIDNMDF